MNLKNVFERYQQLTSELSDATSELAEKLYERFETYQFEVSTLDQELFYPKNRPTIEREGGSGTWYSGADYTTFRVMIFDGSEYLVVETTFTAYDDYGDSHGTAFIPMWLLDDCWESNLAAKVAETRTIFAGRTKETLREEDLRFQQYLALAREFENRR